MSVRQLQKLFFLKIGRDILAETQKAQNWESIVPVWSVSAKAICLPTIGKCSQQPLRRVATGSIARLPALFAQTDLVAAARRGRRHAVCSPTAESVIDFANENNSSLSGQCWQDINPVVWGQEGCSLHLASNCVLTPPTCIMEDSTLEEWHSFVLSSLALF